MGTVVRKHVSVRVKLCVIYQNFVATPLNHEVPAVWSVWIFNPFCTLGNNSFMPGSSSGDSFTRFKNIFCRSGNVAGILNDEPVLI